MDLTTFLSGKKTYIVAAVLALYALVVTGWLHNDWPNALDQFLQALGFAGLRSAIAKGV